MKKFTHGVLSKYLGRQVLIFFWYTLVVLSLIVISNQLFIIVRESINTGYYSSEMLQMVFYKYLADVPHILSFSFFISILIGLGKLYKNSEAIVIHFSGVDSIGIFNLLKNQIFLLLSTLCFFYFVVDPIVNYQIQEIKEQAKERPEFIFFKKSKFHRIKDDAVIYASEVENLEGSEQILRKVFLYNDDSTIFAETAWKITDNLTGNVYLKLLNGNLYNLKNNIQISSFKENTVKIYSNLYRKNDFIDGLKIHLRQYLNGSNKAYAEITFRFSQITSFILMTFIAIVISKSHFREKRNFSIIIGLLIFLAYFNLSVLMMELIESAQIDPLSAFIYTHIGFLSFLYYKIRKSFI